MKDLLGRIRLGRIKMKKYNERFIGKPIYIVRRYDGEIKEFKINSITIDERGFHLNYDFNSRYWNDFTTLSKAKAEKLSKLWAEQRKRRDIKLSDSRAKYKFMVSELPKLNHLIGKPVLVKHGEDNWVKTTIREFLVVERASLNHQIAFRAKGITGNEYLLSREGNNWRYWIELDELELEKKKLQARIDEINAKIKFEEEKKK